MCICLLANMKMNIFEYMCIYEYKHLHVYPHLHIFMLCKVLAKPFCLCVSVFPAGIVEFSNWWMDTLQGVKLSAHYIFLWILWLVVFLHVILKSRSRRRPPGLFILEWKLIFCFVIKVPIHTFYTHTNFFFGDNVISVMFFVRLQRLFPKHF